MRYIAFLIEIDRLISEAPEVLRLILLTRNSTTFLLIVKEELSLGTETGILFLLAASLYTGTTCGLPAGFRIRHNLFFIVRGVT